MRPTNAIKALSRNVEFAVCVIPVIHNKVPATGARAQGKGNRDSFARKNEIVISNSPEIKIAIEYILFRRRQ